MDAEGLFPRFVGPRLIEALEESPVVLVHGPRQCGKTTLAKTIGSSRGYGYISFDDDHRRASAKEDPIAFVGELPNRVILDEVQRVPGLFTSLKAVVDEKRAPGRFLITGSANVLLVPRLADSLAGRMEIKRLHPLSQSEIEGTTSDFLDQLFTGSFARNRTFGRLGVGLAERVVGGGYPAALGRRSAPRRMVWYRDYLQAVVERDVRDLARISSLDALPRLLEVVASQTACLLNITEFAGRFELSRPTIRDYVTLLERVFLLEHLPAWHGNRLARLVKAPKLHVGDTGLASALLGLDAQALFDDRAAYGRLVETFVYQELRREASFRDDGIRFFHYRDHHQVEVDIVLERAGKVAGVEVKAGATISAADFRGLKRLSEAAGNRFVAGVLLYDGDQVLPFGERLLAVPIPALWRST